jgi:hypothetical protein
MGNRVHLCGSLGMLASARLSKELADPLAKRVSRACDEPGTEANRYDKPFALAVPLSRFFAESDTQPFSKPVTEPFW